VTRRHEWSMNGLSGRLRVCSRDGEWEEGRIGVDVKEECRRRTDRATTQ
jgi:hypothetical protein